MKPVRTIFMFILISVIHIQTIPNNQIAKVNSQAANTNAVVKSTSDELPCDPFPPHIRRCELQGGKFNYVTCSCDLP